MPLPDATIKQHYITLATLLRDYKTQAPDRQLLKQSYNVCQGLLDTAKAHPDLLFAQPQLYKKQLPFVVNLVFNVAVLTCLLGVRNKYDESVIVQLMCGSISLFAFEQNTLEQYYNPPSPPESSPQIKLGGKSSQFIQTLKRYQQHIWLDTYLCSKIHSPHYSNFPTLLPVTAISFIGCKLALMCIPNQRQSAISFAAAFKQLALKCPAKYYPVLVPIVAYPSLQPPGSYIKHSSGSLHVVLAVTENGVITKLLPNKQASEQTVDKPSVEKTLNEHVIQSYPAQKLAGFALLNHWWGEDLNDTLFADVSWTKPFEKMRSIQSAPPSLLVIQDQLKHKDTDISVIVKAIEKDTTYSQQIQMSASASNRQKQSVQNIQHSLAMLGFERSSNMLLQHSLLSRLNQQYFPLQQSIFTFSQLFAFIAGELATKTKLVTSEQAKTIAYFAVSRLFTLPSVKPLLRWDSASENTFNLSQLLKVKETEQLKNGAVLLAKAWQQHPQISQVLEHYDGLVHTPHRTKLVNQLGYIIGLSLILARQTYFSPSQTCKNTDEYLTESLKALKLNSANLEELQSTITASSAAFCHLN